MHIPVVRFCDGRKIPVLGLGTWKLAGRQCLQSVKAALELGYAHIDTASAYGNQKEIGSVLKGFNRAEIFLTSKLWISDLRHDSVLKACKKTLKELQTDYLDLYLIHWPSATVRFEETLGAMAELVDSGKVLSIGISNFSIKETEQVLHDSKKQVVTNQVEFHPHLFQRDLLDYCRKKKIVLTAYSPLGQGKIFSDALLEELSKKYGKTTPQICLRWELQKGIVVIPKASSVQHLSENLGIFGWALSKGDEKKIDSIQTRERIVNSVFAHFDSQ